MAYLPVLTGRAMVSCDYYAFPPDRHEYDMPRRAFRSSTDTIYQYFDWMNVTHVVTYHERWKRRFREEPGRYEEAAAFRDIAVFAVKGLREGLFAENSGRVRADFNRLEVEVDDPDHPAVLKYQWHDGLQADPPASCYPQPVHEELTLVGLHPRGRRKVEIRFRGGM